MVTDYVTTQLDCEGKRKAPDPVALGSFGMDSHTVQHFVTEHGWGATWGRGGLPLEHQLEAVQAGGRHQRAQPELRHQPAAGFEDTAVALALRGRAGGPGFAQQIQSSPHP